MLARYLLSSCVCPSVFLSQAGTVPKRLNTGSRKQDIYDSPGTLVFDAKNLCEIPTGSPPTGANRGRVGSNGDRPPISRYISETVLDKNTCMQLLWNANRNSYVLYRLVLFPVTLSDSNYLKLSNFDILYRLCIAFHIFVVSGDRDLVDRSMMMVAIASPRMANHPRKGRG